MLTWLLQGHLNKLYSCLPGWAHSCDPCMHARLISESHAQSTSTVAWAGVWIMDATCSASMCAICKAYCIWLTSTICFTTGAHWSMDLPWMQSLPRYVLWCIVPELLTHPRLQIIFRWSMSRVSFSPVPVCTTPIPVFQQKCTYQEGSVGQRERLSPTLSAACKWQ